MSTALFNSFDVFRCDLTGELWLAATESRTAAIDVIKEKGRATPGRYLLLSQADGARTFFQCDGTVLSIVREA